MSWFEEKAEAKWLVEMTFVHDFQYTIYIWVEGIHGNVLKL